MISQMMKNMEINGVRLPYIENPGYYMSRLWLAAVQWLTGDEDAAHASVTKARELQPTLSLSAWTPQAWMQPSAILRQQGRIDAWRKAGLPE